MIIDRKIKELAVTIGKGVLELSNYLFRPLSLELEIKLCSFTRHEYVIPQFAGHS